MIMWNEVETKSLELWENIVELLDSSEPIPANQVPRMQKLRDDLAVYLKED